MKRTVLAVLGVVLLLATAGSAEWMSDPKPPHRAWEFAAMAPPDSSVALALSLEGHLDLEEASEFFLDSVGEGMKRRTEGQLEMALGQPVPKFLAGFTGNALMAAKVGDMPVFGAAVELEDPAVLDGLLEQFEAAEQEGDYVFFQLDTEVWLARGPEWFAVAPSQDQLRWILSSLEGGRNLSDDVTFQAAKDSLETSESALFLYAEGSSLASGGAYVVGFAQEAAEEAPGFLKFAVFSMDFLNQQSDGFLAYSDRKSPLLDALRKPGRLQGAALPHLPDSALALILDFRWLRDVFRGLAQEFPMTASFYQEFEDVLSSKSDFWKAYDGEVGLATDLLEQIVPEMVGRYGTEPSVVLVAPVTDPAEAYKDMVAIREEHYVSPADECASNLKNIATGLEMYSTDWSGHYPPTTEYLVPNYLRTMPSCPEAQSDTYSVSYQIGPDAPRNEAGYQDYYYLECRGHHHPQLRANHPRYNGVEGFDWGPKREVLGGGPPPLVSGQPWVFNADDGSVSLSAAHDLLRFSLGDRHEEWADPTRTPGELSESMEDAMKWGDGQLIFASQWDMTGLYRELTEEYPEEQKEALLKVFALMGGDVDNLTDTQWIKATPEGLRYRGRGFANTPAMGAGFLLSTAILVPNFSHSRRSGQTTACKSNLKNIGTALEIWSVDNSGKYPESLSQLTPDYLRDIPDCPSAGMDSYSETYRCEGTFYEVYCKGDHHAHVLGQPDLPRYNSERGLIDEPDGDSVGR